MADNITQLNDKNKKIDKLLLTNGWNDKNEKLIVLIGENAATYKYMHNNVSNRYFLYDNILKFTIAILTIIISADSFIYTYTITQSYSDVEKIIKFMTAFLSLTYNFLNYQKLAEKHLQNANSYGELYSNIRNIMCLYKKDRPNVNNFLQTNIKNYDNLEINSCKIPMLEFYLLKRKDRLAANNIIINLRKINILNEESPSEKIEIENDNFEMNNKNNLSTIKNLYSIKGDINEDDDITYNDILSRKAELIKAMDFEMNRINQL